MASVTYDKVYKRFDEVVAVNNLNIEIADKEFLVLVGPSGCGKSTALRLLAGLEDISEGTLKIGDRVVNDIAPKDRDIAWCSKVMPYTPTCLFMTIWHLV